jgi:hypothetical protein
LWIENPRYRLTKLQISSSRVLILVSCIFILFFGLGSVVDFYPWLSAPKQTINNISYRIRLNPILGYEGPSALRISLPESILSPLISCQNVNKLPSLLCASDLIHGFVVALDSCLLFLDSCVLRLVSCLLSLMSLVSKHSFALSVPKNLVGTYQDMSIFHLPDGFLIQCEK